MTCAFPAAPRRLQLGVGLDLPWGRAPGFVFDRQRGDVASEGVVAFCHRYSQEFEHIFVSWQPRDRAYLDAADYFGAFDDLFARIGSHHVRALHHTALNLAAVEPYDRGALVLLTNSLIDRYAMQWVNEDLGLWSVGGKPLPYPLPPYFTSDGLDAAIRNTRAVRGDLHAPLLIEFPGFSDGMAVIIGAIHAYDFFRSVAQEADVAVTLDTGHLLSYQWLRGRRGDALFDDLARLPLDRCFEIHLSGCAVEGDAFLDLHHGVLLDTQLTMLEHLLERCPNVRAVTYEDPVFDAAGALLPHTLPSFEKLVRIVGGRGRI